MVGEVIRGALRACGGGLGGASMSILLGAPKFLQTALVLLYALLPVWTVYPTDL